MIPKKKIPNAITLCNVASGWVGLIFAFEAEYAIALGFVLLGAFFDFWDGFFARKFNVDSGRTGENLDSLADLLTFGITPSIMLFGLLKENLGECPPGCPRAFYIYAPVLMVLASTMRLAKFDISETNKNYFTGVATPINAMFLGFWTVFASQSTVSNFWLFNITIILIFIQSLMLNSSFPTLSVKSRTSLMLNAILAVIAVISVFFLEAFGVLLSLVLYYGTSWGYVNFFMPKEKISGDSSR